MRGVVGAGSSFVHPVTDVGWALAVGYLLTIVPVAAFAAHAYRTPPHPPDSALVSGQQRPGPEPPSDGV
jgi:hypothetical protein